MISKLKRFLKRIINSVFSKKSYLKKTIKCNTRWYGNDYGGFYVNPDCLDTESIVYSFGIGEDISFDRALIENHKCKVFGFDPTPKCVNWIRNQDIPKEFSFYSYGIGVKNENIEFFLPKNQEHVSGSIVRSDDLSNENIVRVDLKNLKTISNELGHNKVNMLKMDIEGYEYELIYNLFDVDLEIDQILIEFHDRFFKNGKEKSQRVIDFLKGKGFEIFAISDTFEEVSFIRKNLMNIK